MNQDEPRAGRPREVVVIEDSPTDAALVIRTLKGFGRGLHMTLLTDGERAYEHLNDFEAPLDLPATIPDLVLVDLDLPRRDGFELLGDLRSLDGYQDVPLVVLTGSDDPGAWSRGYSRGANCVLSKPVDTESFVRVVRAATHYWLDVMPRGRRSPS